MTKAAAHLKKHTTARQKLGQIVKHFAGIFTAVLCGLAIAVAVAAIAEKLPAPSYCGKGCTDV